ncbi:unnamed protein product [Prunus armeniaca]|uniref:EB domain-containing protein n=1 Tax=Prunus armeniaca TaxID=36596 RepID=A0A6J5XBM9_PRUAR|nr:unnamed protein product [Prunus armeniaca]
MEKATSKAAIFIVFLVIASCVPSFSEAMVIKRRCSTTADCETFPCYSKEFKKICVDNLCECKIPNSDGSAQTTENERPCSSQKDCDKINFLCRSGTLKCVNGKCECKIPNSDGSAQTTENERPCSSQKDCAKINFLCRSGTLKCVNGKCICVGVN